MIRSAPEPTFTMADGRIVGLHDSRFDERQREMQLRLSRGAGVWDYAALLDVVLHEPGFDLPRFTGKTAAQWLCDLEPGAQEEAEAFRAWYEAVVRQRLPHLDAHSRCPDNRFAAEVAQVPFTSALPMLVERLQLRRATAAQWVGTLRGLTGKGLKPEELEESGILVRLGRLPPDSKVTSAQLLKLIDLTHALPRLVSECRFGFAVTAGWAEVCHPISAKRFRRRGVRVSIDRCLIRFRHRSFGWWIARVRLNDLFNRDALRWYVLDERTGLVPWQPWDGFADPADAMGFFEQRMKQVFVSWRKPQAIGQWREFALPGHEDYREILLQLNAWPGSYGPVHFRTRNVLVHIRSGIRRDTQDRRVLFLDEVQSDWHAALHGEDTGELSRHGHTHPARAPFRNEWPLLALKVMLWWAQRLGVDGVAWSPAELQAERWGRYGPPELLYRKLLPDAASVLANVLALKFDRTLFRIRKASRVVELGKRGWDVLNSKGVPITKSFRTRAQAEIFADLTGKFRLLDASVLWLDRLGPIRAVPLYGTGTASIWLEAAPGRSAQSKGAGEVVGKA